MCSFRFSFVCKALCSSLKLKHHYCYATRTSEAPEETHPCIQGVCSCSCQHVTLWIWQLVVNAHCTTTTGLACLGFLGTTCCPIPPTFMLRHRIKLKGKGRENTSCQNKNLAESFFPWIFDETVCSVTWLQLSTPHFQCKSEGSCSCVTCSFYYFFFLPVHRPAWWAGPFSLTFFTNMVSIGSIRPFW